jgi:outer membrane murein-binding lipoprotein Lpp
MIDFRYHLVSLVSVFLALAVGIALGAGPLKESIGTTLTSQINQLRNEKDDLRSQLNTADDAINNRDAFDTAILPTLVGDKLAGQTVAVLSLPGVDSSVGDALSDAVSTASGTVTGRISMGGAWTDPNRAADRQKVVADLTKVLPTGTIPSGSTDVQLADLLSDALVSSGVARPATVTSAILDAMGKANLIDVKGKVTGLAGAAIMLVPENPTSEGKVQPTPDSAPATSTYVTLANALDAIGGSAVVSGPSSSASGNGLVAAIRDDNAVKARVSTVDVGQTPMGVITDVLALREQLSGGDGAYGSGPGATDVLPAVPGITSTSTGN